MEVKTEALTTTVSSQSTLRPATTTAEAGSRAPESSGTPAADLRLSEAAQVGRKELSTVDQVDRDVFDIELVRQVREQLEKGTLKIDYEAIAQNLLQEAIELSGKPKSGVTK
jgi:anti-sigma28 factor (negative regulator of flagellin synthesis)